MSELSVRFTAVVCLLVFLSVQCSARMFRRPAVDGLPSNPNDPDYQMNTFSRFKRQTSSYVEDIVVVMDGSGSGGSCEFEKAKKALKNIMDLSSGSGNDVKYAAVTFASSASVNFKFLPSSTAANAIMKIPFPSGSTNTQAGLAEAKILFDDPSSGRRPNGRKLVFLVTDGQSNNKQLTISKAQELKNFGVEIFVVAVGSYIHGIDEMVKVASYPPEAFLFRVDKYQGFWDIVKLVIQQVSPGKYTIVNGQYVPPC